MILPSLNNINHSRDLISAFGGYNHQVSINDYEFYDMDGLSSDYFPTLSPRKPMLKSAKFNIDGNLVHDVAYTENGAFFVTSRHIYRYENNAYKEIYTFTEYANEDIRKEREKKFVKFGAYLIVTPDNIMFNTILNGATEYEIKKLEYSLIKDVGNLTFTPTTKDGAEITIKSKSAKQPSNANDGDYWLDTSGKKSILKVYSSDSGIWSSVATTYITITSSGEMPFQNIKEGDSITIHGLKNGNFKFYNSTNNTVTDVNDSKGIESIDGNYYVFSSTEKSLTIAGLIEGTVKITLGREGDTTGNNFTTVSFQRLLPEVDFMFESNNRLWGCRCGYKSEIKDNADNIQVRSFTNEFVNEIYACKLGDPTNWNCFFGTSTDSYAVSLGENGMFTGGIDYCGNPTFFKEDFLIRIYGSFPAQYQTSVLHCNGVQSNCGDSLCVLDGVLYYKSKNGISAYNGAMPSETSDLFGNIKYHNAIATAANRKYYVAMGDCIFVFDSTKKLWYKWKNRFAGERYTFRFVQSINDFACLLVNDLKDANRESYLVAIDYFDAPKLQSPFDVWELPFDEKCENRVKWEAVSGVFGTDYIDNKYISKLSIRMSMDVGTRIMFYIQYDSMGDWEHLFTTTGTTLRTFEIPVRPKRCDHFRIKMIGEGQAKIYSISKTIEQGSDTV